MGKPTWGKWVNYYDSAQLQVHKALNGLNPPSGFRDLCSAKSGPNLCQIWQGFWSVWGKWANNHDSAQLQAQTIPQNLEQRKSAKRLQSYGFGKSGSRPRGRPPTWTMTTIPFQPGVSEWVIKFNGLSWTADSEVHVVHISCVIIAYTLEWLSSLT